VLPRLALNSGSNDPAAQPLEYLVPQACTTLGLRLISVVLLLCSYIKFYSSSSLMILPLNDNIFLSLSLKLHYYEGENQ
jgi:hypothetical protein